jgi:hypothetical protein
VIKSVTLLQGAFSRFAFSDPLPFRSWTGRDKGALAGMLARIDGPLTVCFSKHDGALSMFYPLSSMAAGDDAAGLGDPLRRWRAMGEKGADGVPASARMGPVGTVYEFGVGAILNVDASEVVIAGRPPSGAHSDIFHPQLAWLVATAGKLNSPQTPVPGKDAT